MKFQLSLLLISFTINTTEKGKCQHMASNITLKPGNALKFTKPLDIEKVNSTQTTNLILNTKQLLYINLY